MAQHTFSFQPPLWRSPTQTNLRSGALLFGVLIWLLLYGWLSIRLWRNGSVALGQVELLLAAACVVLGVLLVLGLRTLRVRWAARLRQAPDGKRVLSLDQLQALSPSEFEIYVAQRIFARHGYVVDNTPDIKDGGVDVRVHDGRGHTAVVQCKRYAGTVGEPTVRDLYGTMIHAGATQAYLVTTGRISRAARLWAADKPIALIDGEQLVFLAPAEPEPNLRR